MFEVHNVQVAYHPQQFDKPHDCGACGSNIPYRIGVHVTAVCYEDKPCQTCDGTADPDIIVCMLCAGGLMLAGAAQVAATGKELEIGWKAERARLN